MSSAVEVYEFFFPPLLIADSLVCRIEWRRMEVNDNGLSIPLTSAVYGICQSTKTPIIGDAHHSGQMSDSNGYHPQ